MKEPQEKRMRGLVDYDDSSSSSGEEQMQSEKKEAVEPIQQQKPQEQLLPQPTQQEPKQKVKLLGFNRGMQSVSKPLLEEPQKFRVFTTTKSQQMEEEEEVRGNHSNLETLNGKRKLPQGMAQQYPCQIEPKYHKSNETNLPPQTKEAASIKTNKPEAIAGSSQESKVQPNKNKTIFVPPQIRNKKGNISTEF